MGCQICVNIFLLLPFCGEGNGNPLQYSCLENPMDRGAWQTTVHGVARVGHNLVTKPRPSPPLSFGASYSPPHFLHLPHLQFCRCIALSPLPASFSVLFLLSGTLSPPLFAHWSSTHPLKHRSGEPSTVKFSVTSLENISFFQAVILPLLKHLLQLFTCLSRPRVREILEYCLNSST